MSLETVGVIGSGTMGRGIAQVAAMAGHRTWLYDISEEVVTSAAAQIEENLSKGEQLGKVAPDVAAAGRDNLETTTDLGKAAQSSNFIIEAVPEQMALKLKLFADLESLAPETAVLATNTSSLSVTEIAAAVRDPGRVIGMHFFNPVHIMKLVEIIRGLETTQATFEATEALAERMGKETVDVKESPGFVTSRINALIGNEAFHMLQEGIASPEDIDKALKLGLNHPMGPFEMVDLVGLDVRLEILNFLHSRLGDKYRPSPLLIQYVAAGRLGRKVGRGVYEY